MNYNKLTEQEMLESLSRSGYLLESEITKLMVQYGFFVESNVSTLDPLTGKSREIDLIAELDHEFNPNEHNRKTIARVEFIFEIKNNNVPLVLLTEYEWSPNIPIWESMKVKETIPEKILDYFVGLGFYDVLFGDGTKNIYTQYCSFSKKKNEELMALHPENIYSGLLKITNFCEELIESWENDKDKQYEDDYFREFLYLPIILINDDLYELETTVDHKNKLKQVDCSHLVFNYHYKQESKIAIIHIVTKTGLKDFLNRILNAEKKVEENMFLAQDEYIKDNKK